MSAEQQKNLEAGRTELSDLVTKSDGQVIGHELFATADLLHENAGLLRALTDTGRDSADRAALAKDLLERHCSSETVAIISVLVSRHWSDPTGLPATVEQLGVQAFLLGAQKAGQLQTTLSELFAISTLLADNRDLRIELSQLGSGDKAARVALVNAVLGGKVSQTALALVERAVQISRHGRLLQTLRGYERTGAELAGTQLVTVTVATALSADRRGRMKSLVERQLGTPVTLAVAVDPKLIGGFRINCGSQAVDASVQAEITEAKRALTR